MVSRQPIKGDLTRRPCQTDSIEIVSQFEFRTSRPLTQNINQIKIQTGDTVQNVF